MKMKVPPKKKNYKSRMKKTKKMNQRENMTMAKMPNTPTSVSNNDSDNESIELIKL